MSKIDISNGDYESYLSIALVDAFITLENRVPQTKKKTKTISVIDVKPTELKLFMESNDIPCSAYFTGADNGYDGWNDILLAWEVDIPTSDKEKLEYKNRVFHDIAFKKVYDLLTTNGYKRTSLQNKERISYRKSNDGTFTYIIMFDNKTVYEMYMDSDLDKLSEYYSMFFKK